MDIFSHALGGFLMALAVAFNYWLSVPVFLVFGFLREQAQHRDEGFFGWITKHRAIEALAWPIGALFASIAWTIIR